MSFLCYFAYWSTKNKDQTIHTNKINTITKVYEIKSKRSFTYARYYYYFNGKKYFSGEYVDNDDRHTLNKYYVIEFSGVDPKYSRRNLDEEIVDKIAITKAGFNNIIN